MQTTTVAAVSTPRGKGGVAMLRVSGPDARAVLARVFRSRGDVPLRPRTAVYGSFYDDGGVFDDGIAVFYASPASYTGEDTAELCCHGGLLVTERLLAAVLAAGAQPGGAGRVHPPRVPQRQADADGGRGRGRHHRRGQRAAAGDRRAAGGRVAFAPHRRAVRPAGDAGGLPARVHRYPDEDLADLSEARRRPSCRPVKAELDALADSHRYGRAVSEGVRTVLVGRTNTGKSSLLNLLLGFERALVSDEAGTTRDVVSAPGGRLRHSAAAGGHRRAARGRGRGRAGGHPQEHRAA